MMEKRKRVRWLLTPSCLMLAVMLGGAASVQDSAVERAERRGLALARYDRAAWMSTDDLQVRLPVERRPEVGGWIVTPQPDGLHINYFGEGAAADRVIYAADYDGNAIVRPIICTRGTEPALSDLARQMAHALAVARAELAKHADWRPCTAAPFNTVVLPPEENGIVPVYFLTAQTKIGEFPFGGHYEVDVSVDGRVAATRTFTRSCLTMSSPAPSSDGKKPAGLVITHLLDPQPTEIHVFEQMQTDLPLFVATGPGVVWKISKGMIARISK